MLRKLLARLFTSLNCLVLMGLPLGAGGALDDKTMAGLATWDGGNFSSQAVAGAIVITPVQAVAGSQTWLILTGAAGAQNATTPTAQQIVQQYKLAYGVAPRVGSTYSFEIVNQTNGIITLVAGTGVTITGTATVAAISNRTWVVTFTNIGDSNGLGATVTFQNVGSRTN